MTFVNPFIQMGENYRASQVEWDLYTGSFGCQADDCWLVAHKARYSEKERLLTWKCPDGHISKIEDYDG